MAKKKQKKMHGSQKKGKQRIGKCFTKSILQAANVAARRLGLNRQLEEQWVNSLPEDHVFPIRFTLLHQFAGGKPIEPHVRCFFVGPDGEAATIDCRMDLYDLLPGDAELTLRLPGVF